MKTLIASLAVALLAGCSGSVETPDDAKLLQQGDPQPAPAVAEDAGGQSDAAPVGIALGQDSGGDSAPVVIVTPAPDAGATSPEADAAPAQDDDAAVSARQACERVCGQQFVSCTEAPGADVSACNDQLQACDSECGA